MGEITDRDDPPISYFELLKQNIGGGHSVIHHGYDMFGHYQAEATLHREGEAEHLLEVRRYQYPSGRLRRMAWILSGEGVEGVLRVEEWSEDGGRHQITSCAGDGEWLWEKVIDHQSGVVRTLLNRESFVFTSLMEDVVRTLEDGTFDPGSLYDLKWEDVREAVLEVLGASRVVPALPFETVGSLGANRLLKLDWRLRRPSTKAAPWCFLELHCTTTGKVSYLRVPPSLSDIMSAIAWTFRMEKEDYLLEQET